MSKETENLLRVGGYCRTSGEGQRNNTSIPNQKDGIQKHCNREKWKVVHFYVDECKTGSKIVGREAFQQMMREAANGKFDVVVVYDIDRFARDGFDILDSARTLKRDFGIDVVDCKGKFDTRDPRRRLVNYLAAGMAEDERLKIMERTAMGRIRSAQNGEPWSGDPPVGRAWDEENKRWYVTERGQTIATMLRRYIEGARTSELARELGVRADKFSQWVHNGQLAGAYMARFHYPELNIDLDVPVPGMPEVVPVEVLEMVKARMQFNRRNNRTDVRSYFLSGFVRCANCGKALSGRTSHRRKKSYYHAKANGCSSSIRTIRGDEIEEAILSHLYGAFLDQPAFDAAVKSALPSADDRQAVEVEEADIERRLAVNQRKIDRLIDAIAGGADVGLLLSKQEALKAEQQSLVQRAKELLAEAAAFPDTQETTRRAALTRRQLISKYRGREELARTAV